MHEGDARIALLAEDCDRRRLRPGRLARWISGNELRPLGVRQRHEARRLGNRDIPIARPDRAAAHERRRDFVVPEAEHVPELVSDDVARDIGLRKGP